MALAISIGSFCFASQQNHLRLIAPNYRFLSPVLDIAGFLSIGVWRYYLFFYVGTLVRRHFDAFIKMTGKQWIVILLIVIVLSPWILLLIIVSLLLITAA